MRIFLLLGANLGDRKMQLLRALTLIEKKIGPVVKVSRMYETEAWGYTEQQAFLNMAVELREATEPLELLERTKQIEVDLGREKTMKWGPRVIDIDILFIGEMIYESEALRIPHALIEARRFTLIPMAELDGGFRHPVLGRTMAELLEACEDDSEVKLFENSGD